VNDETADVRFLLALLRGLLESVVGGSRSDFGTTLLGVEVRDVATCLARTGDCSLIGAAPLADQSLRSTLLSI